KQQGIEFELIVVDNASSDDSLKYFNRYSKQMTLIANQTNLGFGIANNQAAKIAQGKYYCLLNPDAEFESENGLAELVDFAKNNPHYGLIGAKILAYGNDLETPKKLVYPGERHVKGKFTNLPGEIAWVFGAIMLFPREIYRQIDGFDKDYFVYCEDTDISLRVRKAGYEIGHCANVVVRHQGGVTISKKNYYQVKLRKENGLYVFLRKHYSAKEVKFLIRKKRRKAMWRLLLLQPLKLIKKLTADDKIKYLRYKSMYDLSGYYLKHVLKQNSQYCVFRSDYKFKNVII
ncbi:MAG: glycosyltransferase family 2 protein, partial [Pseudomonadota bacterium]